MKAINPATGEIIGDYPDLGDADAAARITEADRAFSSWRPVPFAERSARMHALAKLLRTRKDKLGRLMTDEMGKPIKQSESEIEQCAWVCDFYADNSERFLALRHVETDALKSYVRYDPLGVILAVMPWNFPFWQVFRFAAPAVMAGNVALLKHASNVPGCAIAIEELFREAGFPRDVFQTLLIRNDQVEAILSNPLVRAATLTGSERAGSAVGAAAAQNLKKTVLELGSSDPFIVLADAEVHAAAKRAVKSRTINSGQSCIAAKRFIVEEGVAEEFEHQFIREMESLNVGDPSLPETEVGPLAREDLLDDLHDQVRRSVDAGAHLALGGERLDRAGYFYKPTVLTNVRPGMPVFDEETFGPVAAITRVRNADEAIEMANLSRYGLGASISSQNLDLAQDLAARIDAGCVFVNEIVKSDPRLPFGGVKRSGYGRELAEDGIREFVNIKTVWVDRGTIGSGTATE